MRHAKDSSHPIRHATYAGSWYPDEPEQLQILIGKALAQASEPPKTPAHLAVLPHAGLFFSAQGIAPFFCNLPSQAERLLVLAPSHTTYLKPDRLVGGDFSSYETPLGKLEGFSLPSIANGFAQEVESEHAVEMVMPFLSYINGQRERPLSFSSALISQITDGKALDHLCSALMADLGEESLLDGRTVVVASSDFTHYGRRFSYAPYSHLALDEQRSRVKEDDRTLSLLFAEGKTEEALAFFAGRKPTVCGFAPSLIVSALALRLHYTGRLASYYTSYDIAPSGDDAFVAYSTILWS